MNKPAMRGHVSFHCLYWSQIVIHNHFFTVKDRFLELEMLKMSPEPWLSVEQIAAHVGVSKETIYRWLEKKKVPAHRVGKLWKFKASEVDKWIKNGEANDSH